MSESAIVDTALGILRREGLDAVTMRRVAAALDTAAGSLYVWVDGRDGLVRTVFDRVIATIELDTPDATHWRDQLHALLRRIRQALIEHPGIAAAAMIDPPRGPSVLRLLENMLGLLLAGGLDAQRAVWTADTLVALVTYAAIETEVRQADPGTLADQVSADFSRLSADEFPLITSHVAELVAGDVETRFAFAINAVLDGVRPSERR